MKIRAVSLCTHLEPRSTIRKANVKRDWMDSNRGAYRCLPLVMANQLGWELCLPVNVTVWWSGGIGLDAIDISEGRESAASHFGHGVLSFPVWTHFRTPKDCDLMVTGPANCGKAHASPLEGIVETDWAPMTFTANWRILTPNQYVTWKAGEAFARVYPIVRGFAESFELEELNYDQMPIDERVHYEDWRKRRADWLAANHDPGTWMKDYVKGAERRPGTKCPVSDGEQV